MHGAAEAERLLRKPLLEFASSKSVREILRRESKREPKTQKMTMRKGKGGNWEGVLAEAGFKDCDSKKRGNRIMNFGMLCTDWQLRQPRQLTHWVTHYTNDNKHVVSQCHSHAQMGTSVVRSIPKAYTPSPKRNHTTSDGISARPISDVRLKWALKKQRVPSTDDTAHVWDQVADCIQRWDIWNNDTGRDSKRYCLRAKRQWLGYPRKSIHIFTTLRISNRPFYIKLHFGAEWDIYRNM